MNACANVSAFAILAAMVEFELVAHRGYPGRYPENSLVGMQAALESGVRYVEFDIHLSRDGVPVVVHDANLRRVSGHDALVYTLDYADIAALPAGEPGRFGDEYRHLRIPHLDAMLELVHSFPGVTAFLEVKRASLSNVGREVAMRALRPSLLARPACNVLLSFDRTLVATAGRENFRTGWAFEPWRAHRRAQAEKLQPEFLFTSMRGLPPGAEAFWPGPWKWAVYEVPDLAHASLLAGFGAHLIETDWIGEWVAEQQGATRR